MSHNKAKILEDLVTLRKIKNITQEDLVGHFGLKGYGQQTISNWETGASTPKKQRRMDFAKYLYRLLNLHDREEFDKYWDMIMRAWSWGGITDHEWDMLANTSVRQSSEEASEGNALLPNASAAPGDRHHRTKGRQGSRPKKNGYVIYVLGLVSTLVTVLVILAIYKASTDPDQGAALTPTPSLNWTAIPSALGAKGDLGSDAEKDSRIFKCEDILDNNAGHMNWKLQIDPDTLNLEAISIYGGEPTKCEYDSSDRITKIVYPDGVWLSYKYDDLNRLTERETNQGIVENYFYDSNGKLVRKIRNNGEVIEYDESGQRK